MPINSFKGINSILDVVTTIGSAESTTVYPRGVLLVNSAGNLKLGDGTTAGGTAVGTTSSVAFADVTGKPTTLAGYGITDALANPLSENLDIADGKGFGSSAANAGKLIPTAGTGYNGPSEKDLVLGSEHGIGVFLDPGNDDSGSAFTIWSNLNPYTGTPTEDNYKLKLNGDTGNLGIAGRVTAKGGFRGDLQGSVVADDSTVIIDGVAGTVAASTLAGDLGMVGTSQWPTQQEVRVNDVFGNPGDGYTDLPITQDRKIEVFRIRENTATPATAHAVDLPDAGPNFGKEVFIYSDASGSAGNNIVITFTRMTTSGTTEKTTRTLSGSSFSYWSYKWHYSIKGNFWKETQIV